MPKIQPLITTNDFVNALKNNPGVLIIKFGATWCGPCKQVEPLIKSAMDQAPQNVHCSVVDIDESFELYGFLKAKKMINGVPAILVYYKNNTNYIPDDVVVGADPTQISKLFVKSYRIASQI